MTDKELIARLKEIEASNINGWGYAAIAISRIEQLEAKNIALELALTQSRAETAAVIERAAEWAGTYCWNRTVEGGKLSSPAVFTTHTWQTVRDAIRALATPDQSAALDAVRAEARAQGMREAELRVMRIAAGLFPGGFDNNFQKISDAVAAIKGAKA